MKKFICVVIVVILAMLFMLVACGGESPEPVQPNEIAIAEPTPAIEDPTIDQVLFDQNDINIICKGFVPGSADGWDDPTVKFLITNNQLSILRKK